jgi:hypothetical protein
MACHPRSRSRGFCVFTESLLHGDFNISVSLILCPFRNFMVLQFPRYYVSRLEGVLGIRVRIVKPTKVLINVQVEA